MLTVKRSKKDAVANKKVNGNKKKGAKAAIQLSSKSAKKQIKSRQAYELTMQEIDALMKRGEKNLTEKELNRLRSLAEAAEAYEDSHDPLPLPDTLAGMIRMRMFNMQLTQSFAAKLLGVSDTKFSLILSGKQKPDVAFLKAVNEKLQLDANLLLQAL